MNAGGESRAKTSRHKQVPACESPHQAAPSSSPPQPTPPQRVPQADPVQTGASDDVIWPERRPMLPLQEGEITQEIGEEFCKRICAVYPEVFDGGKGHFLGADATMFLKPRGLGKI